jgi:hypothetical protein
LGLDQQWKLGLDLSKFIFPSLNFLESASELIVESLILIGDFFHVGFVFFNLFLAQFGFLKLHLEPLIEGFVLINFSNFLYDDGVHFFHFLR